MRERGCRQHGVFTAADVYGGGHLLYEAVIAVYFYPSVTQYPLEDGSVAGLCVAAAFLSAFLDALTVVAVIASPSVLRDLPSCGLIARRRNDMLDDRPIRIYKTVLEQSADSYGQPDDAHAGVGTALGGVMTMVGSRKT